MNVYTGNDAVRAKESEDAADAVVDAVELGSSWISKDAPPFSRRNLSFQILTLCAPFTRRPSALNAACVLESKENRRIAELSNIVISSVRSQRKREASQQKRFKKAINIYPRGRMADDGSAGTSTCTILGNQSAFGILTYDLPHVHTINSIIDNLETSETTQTAGRSAMFWQYSRNAYPKRRGGRLVRYTLHD